MRWRAWKSTKFVTTCGSSFCTLEVFAITTVPAAPLVPVCADAPAAKAAIAHVPTIAAAAVLKPGTRTILLLLGRPMGGRDLTNSDWLLKMAEHDITDPAGAPPGHTAGTSAHGTAPGSKVIGPALRPGKA